MLGKKLINSGPISSGANTFASENFNTVLYTGNGAAQRIGGYINRGAVFNGSNSFISLPQNTDFDLNGNGSFSIWVQRNNTSRVWIIDKANGGSGNYGWQLYFHNGQYGFQMHDTSNNIITVLSGTSGIATNAWEHIVITSNTSRVYKMYVNGTLKNTQTLSAAVSVNTNGVTLGKYSLASGYEVNGTMDQLRFFNKELSQSEVTTLYGETFASTTKSTTDIFNDNSGVALYQFESNANDTGGVTGKYGEAAIFNGTSSKIRLPDNLINNVSPQTFSVAFWFKNDNLSAYGNPFSAYAWASGVNYGWSIYAGYGTGKIRFLSYSSNGNMDFSGATNLVQGTWYHCVLTYGGGYAKLYLNGSQDASASISGNRTYISNHTYYIGAANNGAGGTEGYFKGRIEDVRIYTDVLTATEIGYIYNNTTASIPTDNLLAYYKLNGNARDEQQLYDGTATNVTYNFSGTPSNVTYQEATKFSPDLVWIKQRTGTANHILFDSVRGAFKQISTSATYGEVDRTSADKGVISFDTNGFTLKDAAGGDYEVNGPPSGQYSGNGTYVAWCFNAGSGNAVTNTDGNGNTSTVKANQAAGFSIVKYTAASYQADGTATVGHGLGADVRLILQKRLNSNQIFYAITDVITGSPQYIQLDTSAAGNITAPTNFQLTNSVFSNWESIGNTTVNYCFADVAGYQKIDKYTGNGLAQGPIVETGFEPAFVMIKNTNSGDAWDRWYISDNKRLTDGYLYANANLAEAPYQAIKMLSNGFEVITNDTGVNQSSNTYLYLAIAADPDQTDPTVENSFDVVTYTGDGTATQSVEGIDFKPDFIWIKGRNIAQPPGIFDSVRGSGMLRTNVTSAEIGGNILDSYDSNGFTFGLTDPNWNSNNYNYVAWCFKAGDHDDSIPQINTEGNIDSIVSVNDAAGFSIVKFNGASGANTVGHGLSQAPELFIMRSVNVGGSWGVYVKDLGADKYLVLNSDAATTTSTGVWNNTHPTSTVLHWQGGLVAAGGSQYTNIAYCWYSVTGYSKIGSYTGTGSAQTINTGFVPRFVMIKNTSSSSTNWIIIDFLRDKGDEWLYANSSSGTYDDSNTYTELDGTTQGFKLIVTSSYANTSGNNYIYMAFK